MSSSPKNLLRKNQIGNLFLRMIFIFFILIFLQENSEAQLIFDEPFDEANGSANGVDNMGGVLWATTCTACLAGDHYEVQSNALEGQDTNGPATWETGLIDISTCGEIAISFSITSVDVMEACGTGCNSVDWVQLEYNIDGSGWQTPGNSTFCAGPCADLNVVQSDDVVGGTVNYSTGCMIGGTTLQLRISVQTWAGAEIWLIDDVTVSCGAVADAGADATICPGSSLVLNGSGFGTISWNNGGTLSSTTILNPVATPAGNTTYTLSIDASGCVDTDDITISILNLIPIVVSPDDVICPGDCATLTVTGGDFFVWDQDVDITDSSLTSQNVCPVSTTTYNVTSYTIGSNLILNGDFESGNTDFSSSYNFVTPTNTGEAQYNVIPDPENYNGGFSACGDHTTGVGNMMVVNGSSIAGSSVWCQTIAVTANTDYLFSAWLASVYPTNPAMLQFTINGIPIGANLNASPITCIWDEFFSTWNSGVSTSATICITNLNTNVAGNDFALDDISFAPVCEQTESIIVTVGLPTVNAGIDQDVCEGDAVTLIANNPDGANISWNNGVTDGVAFTPVVGSVNYTVTATDPGSGCSNTDVVNVTVVDVPVVTINSAGPFSVSDGVQNLISSPAGGVWSADCGACINSVTGAFNPATAGVGTWSICYTARTIPCQVQECINIVVFNNACLMTASAIFNNPTCFGFSDGSVTVNILDETGVPVFIITDALGTIVNPGGSNAANNLSEGWYYFDVTDDLGCQVIDSVLLVEPGQMTIDLEIKQPSCYGLPNGYGFCDSVYNYTGSYNQISYFWNPNTTGLNGIGEDSLKNIGEGNYNLVINDENGCSESFDFILTYPDSLYFIQFGYEPAYCRVFSYQSGNGVVFAAASGGTPDYTYLWTNLQTGITSNNSTWGGLNPGNYQIAITDDNGCVLTDVITVDSLNPVADFNLSSPEFSSDYVGNAIVNVHFENQSTNFSNPNDPNSDTTFFWNFGMAGASWILSHDVFETFDQTYTTGGTYDVCLVAYNNNGCTDTMCIPIIIYDPLLFVPINIFSPDGDGINDEFTFNFKAQSIEFFSCIIVDRWGVKMYEMTSIADSWDGKDSKGNLCTDGVYFYTYEYTSFNGIMKSGQGTVQMINSK